MINDIKMFFFDMEGTLFQKNHSLDNGKVAPSAWTILAKTIGHDCYLEEEESKDRWLKGEYISYTEWMIDTVRIQMKYGMKKRHLEEVVANTQFHDGARELITFLKAKGIVTALISGGFKQLADIAQVELGINHSYSACEYFFDSDGFVKHFNLLPTDEVGKLIFMRHLADEYGISMEQCAFIGDGKNDVHLAKACGTSIAFNAQPELVAASDLIINQKQPNLLKVIELLDK
ncbi:HAD family hydrolase [Vibrio cholerae]|uniref:HAD family hydrolase n=1 Tax=Vibrio cholerae TaxID=666 RepID=UPI001931F8BD|nr:HAD-IB family phosphatase [Vibrio cholerae]CAB1250282.1 phosphoserine phosphatase [Vibrio cholerae]HDI3311682.1 HAD family phosphatase [Vibrio cholerae]HDL9510981.1 HAD family phosphatase [Vibrio cholerae]